MVNKIKTKSENTNISVLAHIIGPFTYALGTILIYLAYKDVKDEVLRKNLVSALNFQLTCIGIQILLVIVAGYELNKLYNFAREEEFSPFSIFMVYGLILFIQLVNIIASIIGAVSAGKNKVFNYRIAIKFIK